MSQLLVQQYLNEIDRLRKFSGTITEGVISEAFKDLLKAWSRQNNLHFISQYEFLSPQKNRIRPDGTILHDLRVPLGYWEAKDTADDLDEEIRKKLAKLEAFRHKEQCLRHSDWLGDFFLRQAPQAKGLQDILCAAARDGCG
jgi:hypothetical protein